MAEPEATEHQSNTARNFEEAADLVKTIILSVSELVPLFLDKLALLRNKPDQQEIQAEQRRLRRKLGSLEKKHSWIWLAILILVIWNLSLSLILLLKS
ncbi:MAG: hypothetical protein KDK39_01020 [Leptospiraceae bacterium]|nr:hypothetical protein [Leptospiraceae bacterium]